MCGSMACENAWKEAERRAFCVRARLLRIQKWILKDQGPEKDGRGEERRRQAKTGRAAKRKLSELQREQAEEQQQPPQQELEVLPEIVPVKAPQEIQWERVSERTHSSHTRFLATDTQWVCTRCGAQAAKGAFGWHCWPCLVSHLLLRRGQS